MDIDSEEDIVRASGEITPYKIIQTSAKVRSFDFAVVENPERAGSIQVIDHLNRLS